ncbi:transcription factor Tfb4-domain-containing protein [Crassisporium funariophilum]|nr:transcription factor Tfb4-domain-containing protein [Crassisporium funariophilum]
MVSPSMPFSPSSSPFSMHTWPSTTTTPSPSLPHSRAKGSSSLSQSMALLIPQSPALCLHRPAPARSPHRPRLLPPFKRLDTSVVARIADQLDSLGESTEDSALVGALTKALCYVNRISLASSAHDAADPRILILSVSPDLSSSYIPIMNSIFSAQKLKVTIDACQIFGPDTVFLQQAAHLTGGSYLFLERRDALLQYLIMSFLPPSSIRKVLAVPTQDKIDFRAACFCHKNIIDIGFVCSVCLSIFCQPVPVCSTCRTKFPIKTLQRLNASRPMLPSSTSNSTRPSPVGTPQTRHPAAPASHPSLSGEFAQNGSSATINGSRH